MNILFLTIAYPDRQDRNIYSDLMREFSRRGHDVYVLCSLERRLGKSTEYSKENGVMVLRQWTFNLTKTNIIEKSLSTFLIETQFIAATKKHFAHIKFDLVLYSTPPITFYEAIKFVKERDKCFTYLLLKDIFPQNAVDLGMMRQGGMVWRYFRKKEKLLYKISDVIGCMSKANVKYVVEHNSELAPDRVEECPNSINPLPFGDPTASKTQLRQKFNLPTEAVICLYGGNLGKPQGLNFLIDILENVKNRQDVYFLIVGSGTEYTRIEKYFTGSGFTNARLMNAVPKDDYDQLMRACDIGLIFLHPDFTIPNFPSRITAYMEAALPILAATDMNSDIKDVLAEGEFGLWAKSGDIRAFLSRLDLLATRPELRTSMGRAGRRYLEEHYTVEQSYDIITKHLGTKSNA